MALHVDRLLAAGILSEGRASSGGPGRPSSALALGPAVGVGLGIVFQYASVSVGVSDGYGAVLVREEAELDPASEPAVALAAAARIAKELLQSRGLSVDAVKVVVAGMAAPIDVAEGAASYRAIMPQWLHWPLRERLAETFDAVAVVDNDANLMAAGAAASSSASALPLLYLHLSVGVGAGLIGTDGGVYRGADGSAGDIGHIRLAESSVVRCECGRKGCIGAAVGLEHVLQSAGVLKPGGSVPDAVDRLRESEALAAPEATAALRAAGDDAGILAAALVDAFNPRTVVIGGELVDLSEQVTAAIRSRVYNEALPVATHRLSILPVESGESLALLGAARASAEALLHGC
ncbi:MAG: ROK family protein [Curtobacterium sp.]